MSATENINLAVSAARAALEAWSARPADDRITVLNNFAALLRENRDEIREIICRETGKPRWDSAGEVDAMIAKVPISIDAYRARRNETTTKTPDALGATRFKPFGVAAVLGPFNFPGHLPNGHIVPALLAGNTIVFKPSELAPQTGEKMVELWLRAGAPTGAINLVRGDRASGEALVRHREVDAIFFTGSFAAGQAINRAMADQPGKMIALEMGGNNPLIVHRAKDIDAAAYWTIQSAFISAGQRCSCARRLIVTPGNDRFIERLIEMTRNLRVGRYTETPEPFMGPLINAQAAEKMLAAQSELFAHGGRALLTMTRLDEHGDLLSPGLIDVSEIAVRPDVEHFGPMLQVIRVRDLDAAIAEANHTVYGLAAGIFTDDRAVFERFFRKSRAGVVNWNRALTNASSQLPFGGVGCSGNNRPSGSFAADYCSYPVASLENEVLTLPAKLTPGIDAVASGQ